MTAKRFYQGADAVPGEEGFAIQLDGKPVRTPAGNALEVPTGALARAIAAEWDAQGDEIRPQSMPLTGLANAAIDRMGADRDAAAEQALKFAAADLLCYRDGESGELAGRQQALWQPLLEWALEAYGARLNVTSGVVHVDQPAEALEAFRGAVEALDAFQLAALSCAAPALGSLVLALALIEGRIGAEEAFRASQLDETYQIEKWGDDEEATARAQAIEADVEAAAEFLELAKG